MITIWKVRALLIRRGITADEDKDFRLQDNSDGAGPFIAEWDAAKLGAQPTKAELDAVTQTDIDAVMSAAQDARATRTIESVGIQTAVLYAAKRAGDDITDPAVRQTAFTLAKTIHKSLSPSARSPGG